MDVVFLKVNNRKKVFQNLAKDFSGIEPPLWMILLAAYLREKGLSVSAIDAEAENLDMAETIERVSKINPLMVAIVVSGTNPSASTINMTGVSEFLKEFKKTRPNVPIAVSGLHPSALPKKTIEEEATDFVIEGEGFFTYCDLINTLKSGKSINDEFKIKGLWQKVKGKVFSNPRANNISDLGQLPMPAWDLLLMDKYRAHNWHCFDDVTKRNPYAVIYTTLGCPFSCTFCCINSIFGGPGIRYRPPKKVIEEIDFLVKTYKVRNIKILDEMFVLKWNHVEEICDLIIERGYDLNIWVYGRVDTVKDFMLKKMKKAGINWLAYGFEAGSQKVRDGVSKGRFNTEQIKEIVKMTHAAGIHVVANFIFGLPDDDLESMKETLSLAQELNCEYANLYCAMAYPGSKLYEEAVKAGVELPNTWNGYSQFSEDSLPLPTKYLNSGEVLKFRDEAFDKYHSDKKYFKMIEEKFGQDIVEHLKEMCKLKLKRQNYNYKNKHLFQSN